MPPPPPPAYSKSAFPTSGPKDLKGWNLALGQVKLLYLQRRYKQCIARCEKLLGEDGVGVWFSLRHFVFNTNTVKADRIHQAFLYFYAAICHESLGLAAHSYSGKKLPLLNQARNSFQEALNVLPKAKTLSTFVVSSPEDPFSDPTSPTYTSSDDEIKSTPGTSPISAFIPTLPDSPSIKAIQDSVQETDPFANIENSLQSGPRTLVPQSDTLTDIEASLNHGNDILNDPTLRSSASSIHSYNAARLKASSVELSFTKNCLETPPLFPQPLKIMKKLPALPGPPPANPLPPLPPVIPSPTPQQRKSGLATTIDRQVDAKNAAKGRLWCPLPRILASDDNNDNDKENVPPADATSRACITVSTNCSRSKTPKARKALASIDTSLANIPNGKIHQPPPLLQMSSHELRFASLLRSFATQLLAHVTYVESTIAETSFLQQEHQRKKLLGQHSGEERKASYWLLSKEAEAEKKGKTKKGKEWEERIQRLKRDGWHVTKEQKGWKGEIYYRELREKACMEIDEQALI